MIFLFHRATLEPSSFQTARWPHSAIQGFGRRVRCGRASYAATGLLAISSLFPPVSNSTKKNGDTSGRWRRRYLSPLQIDPEVEARRRTLMVRLRSCSEGFSATKAILASLSAVL